jgi:hypothetical protein
MPFHETGTRVVLMSIPVDARETRMCGIGPPIALVDAPLGRTGKPLCATGTPLALIRAGSAARLDGFA